MGGNEVGVLVVFFGICIFPVGVAHTVGVDIELIENESGWR